MHAGLGSNLKTGSFIDTIAIDSTDLEAIPHMNVGHN